MGPGHRQGPPAQGPQPAERLIGRIGDRATFGRLRTEGQRVRAGVVSIVWVPDDRPVPRVAYAIGRRTGGAVVRNRIRRRLRAIVASLGSEVAPGAYLISAGADAEQATHDQLRTSVRAAFEKIRARQGGRP